MKKCKYSKKYKRIKPPKCNNGNPCFECVRKFNENKIILINSSIDQKLTKGMVENESENI